MPALASTAWSSIQTRADTHMDAAGAGIRTGVERLKGGASAESTHRVADFRGQHVQNADSSALLTCMTGNSRTLTSFEALGHAGMMMPGRAAVMCCRMCR